MNVNTNINVTTNLQTTTAFDAQVQELSIPPPESFSLAATLQLLDPFETTNNNNNNSKDDDAGDTHTYTSRVYLMTPSYLQNWLYWAFHQNVKKGESNRLVEALKLAAKRYGLTPPQNASPQDLEDYADPGPIDATFLSLNEGNDLLLSPNVIVKEGEFDLVASNNKTAMDQEFPELLRRVKSLPTTSSSTDRRTSSDRTTKTIDNEGMTIRHPSNSMDVEGDKILCCAVPSRFYEVNTSCVFCCCCCCSCCGRFTTTTTTTTTTIVGGYLSVRMVLCC